MSVHFASLPVMSEGACSTSLPALGGIIYFKSFYLWNLPYIFIEVQRKKVIKRDVENLKFSDKIGVELGSASKKLATRTFIQNKT